MAVFRKITDSKPVVKHLADVISEHLNKGEKVLWLLSGGSFIPIEVEVSRQLTNQDIKRLTAGLIDERFGPVGHLDSNWEQLNSAGFGLKIDPVLTGLSAPETTKNFEKFISKNLTVADFKIACLGVGSDSHISGIKPTSPAVSAKGLVSEYIWDDYHRITTTFEALRRLDLAICYMAGETKAEAFKLLRQDHPLIDVPSQILKQIKQAIIFNDMIGG